VGQLVEQRSGLGDRTGPQIGYLVIGRESLHAESDQEPGRWVECVLLSHGLRPISIEQPFERGHRSDYIQCRWIFQ
jgi:hypothetical protein